MKALDFLQQLAGRYNNTDIDWEQILAEQYSAALNSPRAIVDVGAHLGLHTERFLNLGAEVIAFEPIPHLADALRLRFSGKRLRVEAKALSNREGESTFVVNHTAPGQSGLLARLDTPDSALLQQIAVELIPLDHYQLQNIDFIKIDCEGAEPIILEGGTKTIRTSRPLISVEYGQPGYEAYGLNKKTLYDWATTFDYFVSDLFGNPFETPEEYDACVNIYYWDYFLIPKEKMETMARLKTNGSRLNSDLQSYSLTPS